MLEQSLANGLVAGSTYALFALGFGLIFAVCRFFNFAHGAVYTIGAYVAYGLMSLGGCSAWVAIPIAILGAAAVGGTTELLVYGPMRRAQASPLVLLLASLGMLIALQNTVSLVFGDATVTLREGDIREGIALGGARVTPIQILSFGISILLTLSLWAWLEHTRWGRMIRAVANDAELGSIIGVPTERVLAVTFAVGSGLAAVAAILLSYDRDLTPTMGFSALLTGVVAVIAGGVGSIPGAFLGGFFVGLAQHIGVLWLPTEWQDTVIFVILILFLLLRPQGFLGKPLRRGDV